MLTRLFSIVIGLASGGFFAYLGYHLYIGDPITTTSRKARSLMRAQDWLVETLGMTNAGYALMGGGAVLALLLIFMSGSDDDDE